MKIPGIPSCLLFAALWLPEWLAGPRFPLVQMQVFRSDGRPLQQARVELRWSSFHNDVYVDYTQRATTDQNGVASFFNLKTRSATAWIYSDFGRNNVGHFHQEVAIPEQVHSGSNYRILVQQDRGSGSYCCSSHCSVMFSGPVKYRSVDVPNQGKEEPAFRPSAQPGPRGPSRGSFLEPPDASIPSLLRTAAGAHPRPPVVPSRPVLGLAP